MTAGEALFSVFAGDGGAGFAPAFLKAVPKGKLESLLAGLRAEIGPIESVSESGSQVSLFSKTHLVEAEVRLDSEGRIAGLLLQPAQRLTEDLADAVHALRAVGGDVSVLVRQENVVLASHNPDKPLAVASAFKLGVLSVLQEDIRDGRRAWSDIAVLSKEHRSLPTGQMQDWPVGSPVTLHTLALLMISISDNTATDLLMDMVGRDRVAAKLGMTSSDLLTTREFFALKADKLARDTWLRAGPDRIKVAQKAAESLPDFPAVADGHLAGVEWYVPLTRLCALVKETVGLPLAGVNPGPVRGENWSEIAYKGGSETGVLNFTAGVRDESGRWYCAAATWNHDSDLDLGKATAAFREVLRHLAAQP